MKYLKVFEEYSGDVTKDDYLKLLDCLRDLFDEYDIIAYTNEIVDTSAGTLSTNKFWTFSQCLPNGGEKLSADINKLDNLRGLTIYNIPEYLIEDIKPELNNSIGEFNDYVGKKVDISYDDFYNEDNDTNYIDITMKITRWSP